MQIILHFRRSKITVRIHYELPWDFQKVILDASEISIQSQIRLEPQQLRPKEAMKHQPVRQPVASRARSRSVTSSIRERVSILDQDA
jgi:hypothetical protein